MCDEGEKTCPLCAEEMDLTDQQLKPCKCGYEICVWCWHHIMDMAEKDETEGRCPACRAPYDKEKIVGTAANCERSVAEINTERKTKCQKAKPKSSEGRKQLGSVRVIQRNLVYIVGLPLNLADEDILQQREYFGQYGKVLKVSMSRTATGAIQQFPNNTCSVYITFSKEEEAVRCIQSVHGYVLDGRPLRACFGTTKYCHAWLRNVTCTNPDCLYLHETGSQEDSFTKDEIISAYTRTRVQQMTGIGCCMQRRTGSVLPPPFDYNCNSSLPSATKPNINNASNNVSKVVKVSLPNGTTTRSPTLPAAASWGQCVQAATSECSYRPYKEKSEMASTVSIAVVGSDTAQHSLPHGDGMKKLPLNNQNHIAAKIMLGSSSCSKQHNCMESDFSSSVKHDAADGTSATNITGGRLSDLVSSNEGRNISSMPQKNVKSAESTWESASAYAEKEEHAQINGKIQKLCSDISPLSVHAKLQGESSGAPATNITGGRLSDLVSSKEGRNINSMPQNNIKSAKSTRESASTYAEKEEHAQINGEIQKMCSDVSLLNVHGKLQGESLGAPTTNITGGRLSDLVSSKEGRNISSMPQDNVKSAESTWESASTYAEKEEHAQINGKIQKMCSDVSSLSVYGKLQGESSGAPGPMFGISDPGWIGSMENRSLLQQPCMENYKESLPLAVVSNVLSNRDRDVFVPTDQLPTMHSQVEEDVLCFNYRRLENPEVFDCSTSFPSSGNLSHVSNCSTSHSLQHGEVVDSNNLSAGLMPVDGNMKERSSAISSRYLEKMVNDCADLDRTSEVRERQFGMLQGNGSKVEMHDSLKAGESSIISNILSLDFDSWSDSLTSPQHLANLLGESDKHEGSVRSSSYRKVQNSNQSRFSFARQEESITHAFNVNPPFTVTEQMPRNRSLDEDLGKNCRSYLHNPAVVNGSLSRFEEVGNRATSQSVLSFGSRSQISAPPGFSVPNKAPPPGFSSHEKTDRNFDTYLGNHLPDINLLRNSYQTQPNASVNSTGDIEFMDPAILAVGRGAIQGGFNSPSFDLGSLSQQLNTLDSDSGHNLLVKRSFPAHPNLRYETSAGYASLNDSFDFASRIFDQSQMGNVSSYMQLSLQRSMSNGHWSGWSTIPGGDGLVMAELLRNERLGINKSCDGLENQKYRMPSPGDLYNRSFGM
ncbi:hypothetical protein BT93_B2093 [Corymbia citriodora subsp. variegata]|nr:hypothetical protein BT93_B2093 [Corymbia citriodora subsp. variegata]KAF8039774.1 hypothetical protein BT93_B2093 [Corymbia citriodora subsp. variegata]